ncbi:class I SAM-dependent methyltransferase [Nocardia sp. CA-135398]|uniref:class I SAM-dependent methyltransferase n=1 Tax=Nocardia sp. CA-135398 TaxID=3239977 RepID=UPI003D98B001
MHTGQPSRTALFVANARARHQADENRIFTDPLAVRILGDEYLASSAEFDQGQSGELVRARELFMNARSRFADDTVTAAVAAGTDQVVILGAGLDTTAYRHTIHARFFEVDHPDTQEWKRHRLAKAEIAIPASLTFTPVDFEQSSLEAALEESGLDRTRRTLFIWLGVTMYLTEASVFETLHYIATGPSQLVFDYFYPLDSAGDLTGTQLRNRAKLVERAGEPWRSFFTAAEIATILTKLGFQEIEDSSASELLATYGVRISRSTDSGPHLIHTCTV